MKELQQQAPAGKNYSAALIGENAQASRKLRDKECKKFDKILPLLKAVMVNAAAKRVR